MTAWTIIRDPCSRFVNTLTCLIGEAHGHSMVVSRAKTLGRLTLLALAGLAATLCTCSAVARAQSPAPWVNFEHAFLQTSTSATGKEPGHVYTSSTGRRAYAVDSSDGSFYVLDELETSPHPKFRIQRFDFDGKGNAEAKASVEFSTPAASETKTESSAEEVQLTVDPAHDRVYALIVYRRRETSESEEKALENEEEKLAEEGKQCEPFAKPATCYERFPLDREELVAGELYAFDYQSGKLVSAKTKEEPPSSGTFVPAPIISESTFKAQGVPETPREALLNPRGMAVNPAGEVVITGQEDEQEDIKVERNEGSRECRVAAQLISVTESKTKAGELSGKLGVRYVDNTHVLEEPACEPEAIESVPYSPVITAKGKLLVAESRSLCPTEDCENTGEVWELPASNEKVGETENKIEEFATKPRRLFNLAPEQSLIRQFGAEDTAGPLMSYESDSSGAGEEHGKLYMTSEINGGGVDFAVLALDYSEEASKEPALEELGWTAGAGSPGGSTPCAIPKPGSGSFMLGGFKQSGGREGAVAIDSFTPAGEKEVQIEALQLGPNGSTTGCPHATVSAPSVKVGGVAIKPKPGEKVTLSSTVQGANVESVEWKFDNLTTGKSEPPVVVGTYQFQTTSLEHAFGEEGEYEVTEIVDSDDLAEPVVTQKVKVMVGLAAPLVKFVSAPSSLVTGEEATFEANVKDENENPKPLTYVWKFGDGTQTPPEPVTGSAIAGKHVYSALCTSCTVTLEVTEQGGKTGTAKESFSVNENQAEIEAEQTAKRKAEEAAQEAKRKAEEQLKREEEQRRRGEEEKRKAEEVKHDPEAKLGGTAATVLASGAFKLQVSCPAGETTCVGTITLRTLGAVSAGPHKKKVVLTLAGARFRNLRRADQDNLASPVRGRAYALGASTRAQSACDAGRARLGRRPAHDFGCSYAATGQAGAWSQTLNFGAIQLRLLSVRCRQTDGFATPPRPVQWQLSGTPRCQLVNRRDQPVKRCHRAQDRNSVKS